MDDFFRTVTRFVNERIKPHVNDWDEAGEFPRDLYRQAGELGLATPRNTEALSAPFLTDSNYPT